MIKINHENIGKYLRNYGKYLFVDKAFIEPGVSGTGVKLVSAQDWYFEYHFPGYPVMPGAFIMEVMTQTGALIVLSMEGNDTLLELFVGCEACRFYHQVRPGDVLTAKVELLSYRHGLASFRGEAYVEDVLVATMKYTLADQNELGKK